MINIEGSPVTMEVDTGAAVSIISDKTRNNMPNLQKLTLQPSPATLRIYTGEIISVLGEMLVNTMARMALCHFWLYKEMAPVLLAEIGWHRSSWIGKVYFQLRVVSHLKGY